jgi:transglutaminase-like putative cysteine protease
LILSAAALGFVFQSFAQDFQWRPVSPAELAMKQPTVEKDADAEAIFWEVRLDDRKTSKLTYNHYARVKIFTERGREKYAKFDIPFYKKLKVKDVMARVIKPDGSIVELNQSEIFEREIIRADKVKIQAKSFAVPGIEPGVIVEYTYREEIEGDSLNGERLRFQRDIPIERMTYYVRPYEGNVLSSERYNIPKDIDFTKEKDGWYSMTMTNVPSLKIEPRMPPEDYVRSWALIYYSGFYDQQTWASLARNFSMVMKDFLKPNGDVKKMAAEITASATNADDKLKKIYGWVQKEITNIVFDKTLTSTQKEKVKNKKPSDTLKSRMGDSGDIEQLFASLALASGFDARIVLSGDRSEFFFDPARNPHRSFVHLCCVAVNIDGKWRYFNPGTPFLAYGDLVWYEEDVATIMVGENNYNVGRTDLSGIDKNYANRTGKFKLLEDGTLEGDLTIEYGGQNAITRRKDGFDDAEDKRLDDFKKDLIEQFSTAEISNLSYANFNETEKPIVYSCKIRISGYAQKTGKRIFFQPSVFEKGNAPLFSSSTRVHPIYFRYPWSEHDKIEISLPKNFALENPEIPGALFDTNKITSWEAKVTIDNANNTLNYDRKFYFGNPDTILFQSPVYPAIKKLFDEFQKSDSQTLSLKQK